MDWMRSSKSVLTDHMRCGYFGQDPRPLELDPVGVRKSVVGAELQVHPSSHAAMMIAA
jgi:hypothetical protein